MSNPLLLDICIFLVDSGIAAGDGQDIFRDFTPEKPDALIALHEYTGNASMHDPAVHRSIQVQVRDSNADAARLKAVNIFKALQGKQQGDGRVDFTSERWGQVYLRQPPVLLRRDENDRTYYNFNVGITTTIE